MNILAHLPFIGTTGYANHARSFFCALNKYHTVKVRNYTVGSSWSGISDEPHNGESYLTKEMREMLILQTLHNSDGSRSDFPIHGYKGDFNHDINIILMETDHHYFYDNYKGYKIAYNVWESTRYPDHFFNRLLDYDEVWVPTKWQFECLVEQGYPKERISIVPEGVDVETFHPIDNLPPKNKFRFLHFGRWDFRKSTTEVLRTFSETFKDHDDVEMICSVENPFPYDGIKTTEERIKLNNIDTKNLVFVKFPSRDEYVKYLQEGDVFVSCARSEGWNLPLIEAMSCGTPSIYSNWGGQLEFAENKGIHVDIAGTTPAKLEYRSFPGDYCEPDFNDLSKKLLMAYHNHKFFRRRALYESQEIHKNFNWDNVAKIACDVLNKERQPRNEKPKEIILHYTNGPYLELKGDTDTEYKVEFVNSATNEIIYEPTIRNNWWCGPAIKYYVDWEVNIRSSYFNTTKKLNLENKRVYISFESKSLGDNLAWIPYVDVFRKKHKCNVICSSFFNSTFYKQYPEIQFIEPGNVVNNISALYRLGLFKKNNEIDYEYHPSDPLKIPLQRIASDILGLEYQEIKPLIPFQKPKKRKMVSIAIHSTAQAKYWNNPTGWQEVVDFLLSIGYEVRLLSKEENGYMGNFEPKGVVKQQLTIPGTIKVLEESELFIGISSGLSWLAWACNTPVILISGFSDVYTEFTTDTIRIINKNVCNSCFNSENFDPGDWNWCPLHKNTSRQFECSKEITGNQVIQEIKTILK
jgi:autotransporter strand-loop-strand O-heptosyltransferase